MRLGVGYHGCHRPDHVARDLDAIVAAGATVVMHRVTEEDLAYRPAHVAAIVAASRDRGLETLVDLRGALGLLRGDAVSFSVARDPEIRQRLSDGALVPAACPNDSRTGAWLDRWLGVVAPTGANGILWDGPHLWIPGADRWGTSAASTWSCTCKACIEAWTGHRHGAPGGAMPDRLTPELRLFRQRSLAGLLGAGFAEARAYGLSNVVTLLPADADEPEALPFDDLAALPYVDGLGTDPDWAARGRAARPYVRQWAERVARAVEPRRARSHIWIPLGGIARRSSDDLSIAVTDAAAAGIRDLFVRTGAAPAAEGPDLLSREEAWRIVVEAVRATEDRATEEPPAEERPTS